MDDRPLNAEKPPHTSAEDIDEAPEAVVAVPLTAPGQPALLPPTTWRVVLALALPVLAQQFLILLVGLSDAYLAGHYQAVTPQQQTEALGWRLQALGILAQPQDGFARAVAAASTWHVADGIVGKQAAYQAAQNTANYLAWFLSSYTVLVTVGSTALVARCVGARDLATATHATNQSLLLACALGLLGSVVGLVYAPALIDVLQLKDEAALFAVEYLQPQLYLLVFQVVELGGIACLIGAGDTRTGLWVMLGVAVVNLPLSWWLCMGGGPVPAIGFVGISLGTALAHVLGCAAVLLVLARGRYGLQLVAWQFRPDGALLRRLLRVSFPAAVDSLSVVAGQLWFLSIVNQLGDVASSAHGIALRWEALGFLSGNAFGVAGASLVGRHLGAEQPRQAARSGWLAFGMGGALMCLMGVLFYSLATPMFELFCPQPTQRPIIDAGVPVLRLIAFAMPPLAAAIIFTSALRGAGDTRVPVLFTWIGFLLVRIPLAYWLTERELELGPLGVWQGWDMGLFGAWLAMFADLVVRGVFFFCRFASGAWMRARV